MNDKIIWIKETGQKYIVALLVAITMMFGGAISEIWHSFTAIPKELLMTKEQHKQDSIRADYFMKENNERIIKIEAAINVQSDQIKNIQTKSKNKHYETK